MSINRTHRIEYTPKVGDVVVVFYGSGNPLCHHSTSKEHLADVGGDGCRGRVLKVGRKWAYVSSLGAPIRCAMSGEAKVDTPWHNFCLPPELARQRHNANFPANDWRRSRPVTDKHHIDNILARL